MLPNKLIQLTDFLREAGYLQASLQILENVTKPVLPINLGQVSKYRSDIRFRSDHFWVNEFCEKQMPKIMAVEPIGMVEVFERQLIRAIDLVNPIKNEDTEKWIGYYWQTYIPNRISQRDDADALDILVDGLKDGMTEVCRKSIEDGRKLLTKYLSSEHLIFQRVALFTLRTYGSNYPELIDQALLQLDKFEASEYIAEYRGLLRDQFQNASEEVKGQVISWILAGPQNIESTANYLAKRENRETTDEDRNEARESWTLYHLEIIRDFLTEDVREKLVDLTSRYGKPNIDEKPRFSASEFGRIPSPVPVEELEQLTFDKLKQLFLTYVPDDLFLNPRESLAQAFKTIVQKDEARYADFAPYLLDPEIRFIYIYQYLSAIHECLRKKTLKLSDAIIDLCEYVVVQNEDPFIPTAGSYEPGLLASQIEAAWVIEESLRSDDPYLSRGQLDRLRLLLISLVHHKDPEQEDVSSNSFDPFTRSMNCIRGVAMHGIMHYSLYLVRQQGKIRNEKLNAGFLEPEIQVLLEEKLDIQAEPSLAVHSVFGAFLPQLHYLSRDWLEQHVDAIFPEAEEKSMYWEAAWDAYVFASHLFKDIFILLLPQYQKALHDLGQSRDDEFKPIGSINEPIARHVMAAYLSNLTSFGHENRVIDQFFENAPDSVRANAISLLSDALKEEKPSPELDMWEKLWFLWQKRMALAVNDTANNSQEISNYMRWLENVPVDLSQLYPILQKSVPFLHDGFDVQILSQYVAKYSAEYPLEAATLLRDAIQYAKETWWAPDDKDEEHILHTAMASDNLDARQIALEVINYRGEHGDFRWKKLLI